MKEFNLEKYLIRYKGFKKTENGLVLQADWDECEGDVYNAFRNKGFTVTFRNDRGAHIHRVFIKGYEVYVRNYTYDIDTNLYTINCEC